MGLKYHGHFHWNIYSELQNWRIVQDRVKNVKARPYWGHFKKVAPPIFPKLHIVNRKLTSMSYNMFRGLLVKNKIWQNFNIPWRGVHMLRTAAVRRPLGAPPGAVHRSSYFYFFIPNNCLLNNFETVHHVAIFTGSSWDTWGKAMVKKIHQNYEAAAGGRQKWKIKRTL